MASPKSRGGHSFTVFARHIESQRIHRDGACLLLARRPSRLGREGRNRHRVDGTFLRCTVRKRRSGHLPVSELMCSVDFTQEQTTRSKRLLDTGERLFSDMRRKMINDTDDHVIHILRPVRFIQVDLFRLKGHVL